MDAGFNTAVSGFQAAQKRLQVAAQNVANLSSTRTVTNGVETVAPPPVLEVVQSSQETGGVRAEIRASERPPLLSFDPANGDANAEGLVARPNVDIAEELVDAKIASYDAQANLKTIRVKDDLFKSVLDIIT